MIHKKASVRLFPFKEFVVLKPQDPFLSCVNNHPDIEVTQNFPQRQYLLQGQYPVFCHDTLRLEKVPSISAASVKGD